jgi:hypothetical protein
LLIAIRVAGPGLAMAIAATRVKQESSETPFSKLVVGVVACYRR